MLLKLLKAISMGPSTIRLDMPRRSVSANVRPFEFDVHSITLTEGRLSTAVTTGALQLLLTIIFPLISYHLRLLSAPIRDPVHVHVQDKSQDGSDRDVEGNYIE